MDRQDASATTASRRGVLLGAGAVGAGAVLVACSGAKTTDGSSSEKVTPPPTAAPVTAKVADVPVGGGLILEADELVITQPQAGQFHAFSAVCPHQGCMVNAVTDETIACPCHGSSFSITDGSPVAGPATESLAARTVTVTGAELTVT